MPIHQLYADHPASAMAFYAAVFRWSFLRQAGGDSWWISSGPMVAPRIDGLLHKRVGGERGHLGALHIPMFELTIERIKAHGGRLITPIRAGVRADRQVYAIDPEGNSFRLIEVVTMPVLSLPVPAALSPFRMPALAVIA